MRDSLQHPTRLVPLAFLVAIAIGTALLMLPMARAGDGSAPFLVALFTATSAACVNGLIVVDTPTYWSGFGQVVILLLFQVGGFGIMAGATLLGILVTRRLRLATRLLAQTENRGLVMGDVFGILRMVLAVTLSVEAIVAVILTLRLHYGYGEDWGTALWHGIFQAASAFNNSGFSSYSDSLIRFALDPMILVPMMFAILVGGVGFPVLHDLRRETWRPGRWMLHTKLTLLGTAILLPAGFVAILLYEWNNVATLGQFGIGGKFLNALFHSVTLRTTGFNTVDVAAMTPSSFVVSYVLMMIGGGSAGTAGGIKVGTFLILGLAVWAEIRGDADVNAFGRRVSGDVLRQAVTVVLLAIGLVSLAILALLGLSDFSLTFLMFEAISAFSTTGISTGITGQLPAAAQVIIIGLMFVGRIGTITIATGLALRARARPYRYPEERPIVG
ncbi:potassium uptake TrkH family protein [Dongia mobilis]|uniref:Potassium uptake TrkH family protein n=1 Tax=Dongia mobilis TaxID=578943 RepID=A0A4R6WT85_9PROT|nr:potassium transporter TrkG [Dongia mobilis]TDQ82294.1 potassium uptake TrkH family protein [Dongia mobilis]